MKTRTRLAPFCSPFRRTPLFSQPLDLDLLSKKKKKKPSAKRFMPGYKPQRGIATRQSKLSKWKGGIFFCSLSRLFSLGRRKPERPRKTFCSNLSLSLSRARASLSPPLFPPCSSKHSHNENRKIEIFKTKTESAWKLFVYTTLTLLAAASTFPSGFFLHTPDFWKGCTKFPPCNYQITRPMGLVYALELGEFFFGGGGVF